MQQCAERQLLASPLLLSAGSLGRARFRVGAVTALVAVCWCVVRACRLLFSSRFCRDSILPASCSLRKLPHPALVLELPSSATWGFAG